MVATTASLSETALHHLDALPVGTRLAEFELQGLMGVGGFGMVYRAYDHSLHRLVAIKEYMPAALAARTGLSVSMRSSVDHQAFHAGLRSFMAEARLLAQFDHPSLVKVFRVWEQNNTAYLVMPFYQGMTLKQARAQMRSPPPEAWLRKLLWSMLESLKVLHRHHMVHRDLSPDNIFLQDVGPPVLLDLGAARRAIGDKSQRHTAILKVNYAPIEQYADSEDLRQGPWSDLYALAAVVHGCLCDEAPLPATFRVLRDRMPSPQSVAEGLHARFGLVYAPAFVEALTRALAIQPADRPQTAAAFADLMQLEAPPAMDRFDWRAELGDVWQPSRQTPGAAEGVVITQSHAQRTQRIGVVPVVAARTGRTVETDLPIARAAGDVRDAPTVRLPAAAFGEPARAPAVAGRRRRWTLALGAAAVGLFAASVVGLLLLAPAPPTVSDEPRLAASAPPGPGPGPVSDAPLPGPVTIEAELRPLEAPPAAPASQPPAATAAAPPVRAEVRSEVPRPARARPLTAEDICPDSNFLTRPMCLHSACQTPRYAAAPVCVENTRRLQNNSRNNNS